MESARTARGLPGVSAGAAQIVLTLIVGAALALGGAVVFGLGVDWAGLRVGHLPWPALKWAFTTPAGLLTSLAVASLALGLPLALLVPRLLPQRQRERILARAVDVSDLPPADWPTYPRDFPLAARERPPRPAVMFILFATAIASLALLVAAAILLKPYLNRCTAHGCPPSYPVTPLGQISVMGALLVVVLGQYWWLRRLEVRCGIWLREPKRGLPSRLLLYVRRPGVTSESASTAIARFVQAHSAPIWLASGNLWMGLYAAVYLLLMAGSLALFAWLQLHWLPG